MCFRQGRYLTNSLRAQNCIVKVIRSHSLAVVKQVSRRQVILRVENMVQLSRKVILVGYLVSGKAKQAGIARDSAIRDWIKPEERQHAWTDSYVSGYQVSKSRVGG